MVEEIAQLFVDVRDGGNFDPPRPEQQRRKGQSHTIGDVFLVRKGGVRTERPPPRAAAAEGQAILSMHVTIEYHTPTHHPPIQPDPKNKHYPLSQVLSFQHAFFPETEDFVVALLKERTITGKVVIFVQSKRSCQQLADRLKQMRHLEVR